MGTRVVWFVHVQQKLCGTGHGTGVGFINPLHSIAVFLIKQSEPTTYVMRNITFRSLSPPCLLASAFNSKLTKNVPPVSVPTAHWSQRCRLFQAFIAHSRLVVKAVEAASHGSN